jgi:hypothetical protein
VERLFDMMGACRSRTNAMIVFPRSLTMYCHAAEEVGTKLIAGTEPPPWLKCRLKVIVAAC